MMDHETLMVALGALVEFAFKTGPAAALGLLAWRLAR